MYITIYYLYMFKYLKLKCNEKLTIRTFRQYITNITAKT